MKNKIEQAKSDLYWESRERDPSVWNSGTVPAAEVAARVGAIVEYGPWRSNNVTFRLAGMNDPIFHERVRWVVFVWPNGTRFTATEVSSWHGGENSGHPTLDLQVE